jgi:anti-sigma factor RsiW
VRCEELDELIEALADGEPVPPEVEAHVSACAACRGRVELARAVDRLLLTREVPAPPAAFTVHVMRLVQHERWRVEQFVDAGFNVAIAAGVLVVLGGAAGLLWSFGWFSVDAATVTAAVTTLAPWATELASQAQTLIVAIVLLSSALALWWWVEGGDGTLNS